jgi:hypothetical protein
MAPSLSGRTARRRHFRVCVPDWRPVTIADKGAAARHHDGREVEIMPYEFSEQGLMVRNSVRQFMDDVIFPNEETYTRLYSTD